jgi:hypothetical protein
METIPETVLWCEKQIEQSNYAPQYTNSAVLSTDLTERQLIWSSHKPDDWKILVYKQTERWEACFFRQQIHEHAIGSSFASVRQRAEQRISLIDAAPLRASSDDNKSIDC